MAKQIVNGACASLGSAVCAYFSIIFLAFLDLLKQDCCNKQILTYDFLWAESFLGKAGVVVVEGIPGRYVPQTNLC